MRTLTYSVSNFTTTSLAKAIAVSEKTGVPYTISFVDSVERATYNPMRATIIRAKAMARNNK